MMNLSNSTRLFIAMLTGICLWASAAEDATPPAKEKRSWLEKVKGAVGLGKKAEPKTEPPPAPPSPPTEKEKEKPAPKKKAVAPTKPKSQPKAEPKPKAASDSAKKSLEPASSTKKETPKPAPPEAKKKEETVAKSETNSTTPAKSTPKEDKSIAATESKPAATTASAAKAPEANAKPKEAPKGADMSLDSEFATLKKDEEPTTSNPAASTAPKTGGQTSTAPPPGPPPPLPPAANVGWQIFQHDGHDWVTAESMHAFYRFSEFKVSGDNVWFKNPTMILKGQVGRQDLLINNIKFVLSYPITMLEGKVCFSRVDLSKLLDPVIRPWLISAASEVFDTVVLDPGHGGHDSGAKGIYGYEKDFTLELAKTVRTALIKRGFKVVMTRQDDRFISLGGRAQFANAVPKSIFISLHFNSSGSSASGIETFALTPQGSSSTSMGAREWDSRSFTGNTRDAENIALATAIHAMVIHRYKLIDRGIKRARWSVLTGCTRPGILFEGGFVTNEKDGRLIASPLYREGLAAAIGDALLNYRAALHPRTAQRPSR